MTAADAPLVSVGLVLPTSSPAGSRQAPDVVPTVAAWAEQAGFSSLWTGDHIFHPTDMLESVVSLSFAAATTSRVALGTSVLLLPMRRLSVAAKQIATLATLSGGRLSLGVGVGGEFPAEWEAAGVSLAERGRRLDEALPLLRALLGGERVEYQGAFHQFPGVRLQPVPPPIPVLLAGRQPRALKRVGRSADGWIGFLLSATGYARTHATIEAERAQAGRSHLPFEYALMVSVRVDDRDHDADLRAAELQVAQLPAEHRPAPPEFLRRFIAAGTPDRVRARLLEYAEAGCRTFILNPIAGPDELWDQIEALAEIRRRL